MIQRREIIKKKKSCQQNFVQSHDDNNEMTRDTSKITPYIKAACTYITKENVI